MPSEEESWVRVDTANFSLIGNARETRMVGISENLERLRATLLRTSEGMTLSSPLDTTIFVFKDSLSMAPYNLGADGRPENRAGYFLRSTAGNLVAVDASVPTLPYAVIYHEYMHYVLENSVPGIPLWLNEGLSEVYSTFRIRDGVAEIALKVPEHLSWLASHEWMTLDQLFSVDTSSADYHEGVSLPETRSLPLPCVPTTVFRARGMRNGSLNACSAPKNRRRRQRISGLGTRVRPEESSRPPECYAARRV
jgi:hypothetical protein